MPELPDVEIFRLYINKTSLNKKITHVDIEESKLIKQISKRKFSNELQKNSFAKTYRHGKYLFILLADQQNLVIHFGMDGEVEYFTKKTTFPNHTAILFAFIKNEFLAYITIRKLGFMTITDNMEKFIQSKKLGPDALEVTWDEFKKIIHKSPASVKSWLMNQKNLCGIGNTYSDEILFMEKLYPKTKISNLSESQIKSLFNTIKKVLKTAIKCHVDANKFPKNYLLNHRHKNGKCPVCHTNLQQMKFSGRTCYYCPHCQAKDA